jgi:hypothetical protein
MSAEPPDAYLKQVMEYLATPDRIGSLMLTGADAPPQFVGASFCAELEKLVVQSIDAGFYIRYARRHWFPAVTGSPPSLVLRHHRSDEHGEELVLHACADSGEKRMMWGCSGSTTHVETVLVFLKQACWSCGGVPHARCSGCKLAIYCNAACQHANRTRHKRACKAIAAAVV